MTQCSSEGINMHTVAASPVTTHKPARQAELCSAQCSTQTGCYAGSCSVRCCFSMSAKSVCCSLCVADRQRLLRRSGTCAHHQEEFGWRARSTSYMNACVQQMLGNMALVQACMHACMHAAQSVLSKHAPPLAASLCQNMFAQTFSTLHIEHGCYCDPAFSIGCSVHDQHAVML